jgi:hypothetical protein
MAELTDVLYPVVCWAAWREGDEYASVELVRALCSPNLIVRVIYPGDSERNRSQNIIDKRNKETIWNSQQQHHNRLFNSPRRTG